MSDNNSLDNIAELTPQLKEWAEAQSQGQMVTARLEDLFPSENEGFYNRLKEGDFAIYRGDDGRERLVGAQVDSGGRVMAVAAAIPRNAGRSEDFLQQIE